MDKKIDLGSDFVETEDDLQTLVAQSIHLATEHLFSAQRKGFYWCGEMESSCAPTVRFVILSQILDPKKKLNLIEQSDLIVRYLLKQQNFDGGWPLVASDERAVGDLSTTVETYLALRILGCDEQSSHLLKAQQFILKNGGVGEVRKIRLITRVFLAMFGLVSWETLPNIPTEVIFLISKVPKNFYPIASWVKEGLVSLLILFHHRPIFALPNGLSGENDWFDHLWKDPSEKKLSHISPLLEQVFSQKVSWNILLNFTDPLLKVYNRFNFKKVRILALKKCSDWIIERQESSGGWSNLCPVTVNHLIALYLENYSIYSNPIKNGIQAIRDLSWEDSNGFRIQPGSSPILDTAFSIQAVVESSLSYDLGRIEKAARWILDRQIKKKEDTNISGWSPEYFNSYSPNVDCTATVILAILRHRSIYTESTHFALKWILEMQNRDGGWGSLSSDQSRMSTRPIPESFKSFCDLSTPDVTGRVIETLAFAANVIRSESLSYEIVVAELSDGNMDLRMSQACKLAVQYLKSHQDKNGAWFGRWGVNSIYGTSRVLCGLSQLSRLAKTQQTILTQKAIIDEMISLGVRFLKKIQNLDGGWGEETSSYSEPALLGKGQSTASQTSWALMGLLTSVEPTHPMIEKGIRWLIQHQKNIHFEASFEGGHLLNPRKGMTWSEDKATGTLFPKHVYLRYDYYRYYFPMIALGRYLKLRTN